MKFNYKALQPDGSIITGLIEANDRAEVLDALTRRDLKPIAIKEGAGLRWRGEISFRKGINSTDKIFLTKYLALMLKAGTDLFRALDILIADFEKPAIKSLLLEVKANLEKGQPFYMTFARYPKYFSPIFVNLVKAGEVSGNLDQTFENLSVMLAKEEDLRRRIRSALTYPILLVIASTLVVGFMVTFALPRIAEVFLSGGLEPPPFSRAVFAVGLFIANNLIILIILFFGVAFGAWLFFFKTLVGRRWLQAILARIPVIKSVIERVAIQRMATTLGYLIKAGLPIIDSLKLSATAIGHERISKSLVRVADEGVAKGLTLGEAFHREAELPQVVINLISVSEKAGHLDDVLFTLSTFYDSEIDSAIKSMVTFIEPALLVVIGGIVGLIAMSVIVPIYQLVGAF